MLSYVENFSELKLEKQYELLINSYKTKHTFTWILNPERKRLKVGFESDFLQSCKEGILEIVIYFYNLNNKSKSKSKSKLKTNFENELNVGLTIACKYGHLDIVAFLFIKGAYIHYNDDEPLIKACENSQNDIVSFLIKNGANSVARFNLPIRCSTSKVITEILFDAGANIHANKEEALYNAIKRADFTQVKFLLEKGADFYVDNCGPLVSACEIGSVDIIDLLLTYGSDIHCSYDRPIRYAVKCEKDEAVKFLLEKGADRKIYLNYLLCFNIKQKSKISKINEIIQIEDIDKTNVEPVKTAVMCRNIEVAKLLLDNDFYLDTTVSEIAQKEENEEMINLLSLYLFF